MAKRLKSVPWKRGVAEFIVIFAGVSLSLLADDWRQGREELQAEGRALSAILQDLRSDSSRLEETLERVSRVDRSVLWLVRRADDDDVSDEEVLSHLLRVGFLFRYEPVRSAYLGARDSGQLGLVHDDALRARIIDYYEWHQPVMLRLQEQYLKAHDRAGQHARPHLQFIVPDSATSFWPPAGFGFATSWTALRTASGFRHLNEGVGAEAGNWGSRLRETLSANDALADAIADALSR